MATTLSAEQFKQKYGDAGVQKFNVTISAAEFQKMKAAQSGQPKAQEQPGFLQSLGQDLTKRADNIIEGTKKGVGLIKEAIQSRNAQPAIETTGQVMGGIAEVAITPLIQSIGGLFDVIKNTTPEGIKKPIVDSIKEGFNTLAEKGPQFVKPNEVKYVMDKYQEAIQKDPSIKRDLEAASNLFAAAFSLKDIHGGVQGLGSLPADISSKTSQAISKTVQLTKGTVQGIKNVGSAVAESQALKLPVAIGTKIGEGVSNLPRRIGTNLEAAKVERATIQSLPTKIAQNAAKDGVDPNDLKFIYSIPKNERAPLKKLYSIAEDFSTDKSKANPIQAVGNSITKRVKELDSVRMKIGKKLGAVSEKLGVVLKEDVQPKIFENLKKVPGLNGLRVSEKGTLIFKDTSLATELSKADRTAIQKAFSAAVKSSNGKQKHLLRQELFEILGGKKRSLQQLTDTQEKAFEAIRKGLSDVLEAKNPNYKILSNEYRKAIQPLQDMRKFMKTVVGVNEDILDMKAGLLARRLTSNVASNPEIRNLLETMDNVLKLNGSKVPISTKRLQDFYNILDKHLNIAGGTTFQGQVQKGVEKASGLKEAVMETARSFAGKTDEVTKKALKQAIEEALK